MKTVLLILILAILPLACPGADTWKDLERKATAAIDAKRAEYLAAHPALCPAVKKAIEDHKPYLGMSEAEAHQVFELWNRGGWLDDVNRTTTRYGETCQWVIASYSRIGYKYLYFDNGKLVAIER